MITVLGISLAVSVAINISMFLLAFKLKSDKLTDASYAFSFIVLAFLALMQSDKNIYDVLLAVLVVVWALRIGGFLLYRVMKTGKDRRFDGMREDFVKFGKFWLMQAVAVWVLMIPSFLAIENVPEFTPLSFVGIVIWGIGLTLETVADVQKSKFAADPKNKDKWIDLGVWKYSRHPNYFGEILVWVGIYLYVMANLVPLQALAGAVSPIFITVLLLFVSGVPILEKSADKRWGKHKAYRTYKSRTSILIPLPKFNK